MLLYIVMIMITLCNWNARRLIVPSQKIADIKNLMKRYINVIDYIITLLFKEIRLN